MAVAENIQNREAHKEFTKNGTAGKRVKLEIKRQDGPDGKARWDKFDIPWKPGMNVISAMMDIATDPVTVDGLELPGRDLRLVRDADQWKGANGLFRAGR